MAPKLAAQRLQLPPACPDPRVTKANDVIKSVYLVTIPHPRGVGVKPTRRLRVKTKMVKPTRRLSAKTKLGQPTTLPPLRAPSEFSRADIERAFLDAAQRPVYEDSRNQGQAGGVELEQMAVFMELHKPQPGSQGRKPHYHVALQAKRSFRFLPIKRAIRTRNGLETNWSTEHSGYFSALRYGALPSPTKPMSELDPEPRLWSRTGAHKPLFEACQEPATAAATQKRRELAVKKALEEGKAEPRVTEMDLYAAIAKGGFRNSPDDRSAKWKLIAHLKETSPPLYSLAFKLRAKLTSLIDDVWSWEDIEDTLPVVTMTRVERLHNAATQACTCGGEWWRQAELILRNNVVDRSKFFTHVFHALQQGRGPRVKVLVLSGQYGGEGKSLLLAPLRKIYGIDGLQESPQPGNFPLLGLEEKSVVLLDEWRFDESVLRLPTQLLWYEGKPFPISRPQNQSGTVGHMIYQGSAPIFVTTKAGDLLCIQDAADAARRQGLPSQHTMLLRRLEIYPLYVPTIVSGDPDILECASCFARMTLQNSQVGRQAATASRAAPQRDIHGMGPDAS